MNSQPVSVTIYISTIKSNTQSRVTVRNFQTCRGRKGTIEIFIHPIEGRRGEKGSRKEDVKQKMQNKTGEITPKMSAITMNVNKHIH